MSLNARQARFVEEYIIDLNASKAAVRAGYSGKNAESIGYQLLQKTPVQEALKAALAKRSERTLVTQDMVIRGLLTEAEYKDEGASHGARVSAWEKLGKHLGMFTEKLEHSGPDGGAIKTAGSLMIQFLPVPKSES